jgi:hypothetical protein
MKVRLTVSREGVQIARKTLKVCPMFHDFGWDEAMSTCHQREGVRTGRVPPSFPGLFTKSHWNMETFRQQYQQQLLPHHVEETYEVRISRCPLHCAETDVTISLLRFFRFLVSHTALYELGAVLDPSPPAEADCCVAIVARHTDGWLLLSSPERVCGRRAASDPKGAGGAPAGAANAEQGGTHPLHPQPHGRASLHHLATLRSAPLK